MFSRLLRKIGQSPAPVPKGTYRRHAGYLDAKEMMSPSALYGVRSLHTVTISEERLHEFLKAEVAYFAEQDPQSLSLQMIIDASTPELAADLAMRELPVRYAHRIQQLEQLPGWRTSHCITQVHGLYFDAFRNLRLVEESSDDMQKLTETISEMKQKMQGVVPNLANGIRELQQTHGLNEVFTQEWLDTFLLSRIGTEMLATQYITAAKAATDNHRGKPPSIVNNSCDPTKICELAAKHARKLCKQHFGLRQNVQILVETEVSPALVGRNGRIRFPYVPQYLFYILLEILKNSARATVENTPDRNDLHEKPVIITVGADESQVVIRVSDLANGIPFRHLDKVWSYMYSTAPKGAKDDFVAQGTPLAGYGVGLPLSALYARYLGGSLSLMSMPGVGTNAYLYLKRIESEAREEIPSWTSMNSLDVLL